MFGHLYRISQQSHNNPTPVSAFLASTRVGTPYKR